ncbi:hypothetical protein ES703_87579 [subsurface metagenome]
MVTPTIEQIREKALTLYFHTEQRASSEEIGTPEDYELKESGHWMRAQHELMRNPENLRMEDIFGKDPQTPVSPKDTVEERHVKLVMALVQLRKRSAEDLITSMYAEEYGQAMQQVRNLRGILALEWQIKQRTKSR